MVLGDPPPDKWQGSPIASFHPIWLVKRVMRTLALATYLLSWAEELATLFQLFLLLLHFSC